MAEKPETEEDSYYVQDESLCKNIQEFLTAEAAKAKDKVIILKKKFVSKEKNRCTNA